MKAESKKSNRNLFIIAAVVAVLLVGAIIAYLMANDKKINDFVVGRGDDTVEETFNKPTKLSVGSANPFQKQVQVKNTGENPCFVRVYMDFSDSSVKDMTYFYDVTKDSESMPDFYQVDNNGDYVLDTEGNKIILPDWYKANSVDIEGTENWLNKKWVYVSDTDDGLYGYFYYTVPLDPDASTEDLINWVTTVFGDKVKQFDIYVYSETVQTVGIDGTDYGIPDETTGDYNWREAWTKYLRENIYLHEEPEQTTVLIANQAKNSTNPFASDATAAAHTGNTYYNTNCYTQDIANLGSEPTSLAGMFSSSECSTLTDINFEADLSDISDFSNMFSGCDNVERIIIKNTGDPVSIDLSAMFKGLTKLQSVTLDGFNIAGAESAFEGCTALTSVTFKNGTVTGSADSMFKDCTALTDTSSISTDYSGITSMNNMFDGCSSLTKVSLTNATSVTSITGIFNGCSVIETVEMTGFEKVYFANNFLEPFKGTLKNITIEGDLSQLTTLTSIVKDENNALIETYKLTNTAPNGTTAITSRGNLPWWSKLKNVKIDKFKNTTALDFNALFNQNSSSTDLETLELDLGKISNISTMLQNRTKLTTAHITADFSEMTATNFAFSGCSSLNDLELKNTGTDWRNVTNAEKMFENCSALTEVELDKFGSTSAGININKIINNCSVLTDFKITDGGKFTNTDIASQNTCVLQNLTLEGIFSANPNFYNAGKNTLKELTLGGDFSSITTLQSLVQNYSILETVTFNGDLSNCTNFQNAFSGCAKLKSVVNEMTSSNLSPTNIGWMFENSSSITDISFLNGMDLSNCTTLTNAFKGTNQLSVDTLKASIATWKFGTSTTGTFEKSGLSGEVSCANGTVTFTGNGAISSFTPSS